MLFKGTTSIARACKRQFLQLRLQLLDLAMVRAFGLTPQLLIAECSGISTQWCGMRWIRRDARRISDTDIRTQRFILEHKVRDANIGECQASSYDALTIEYSHCSIPNTIEIDKCSHRGSRVPSRRQDTSLQFQVDPAMSKWADHAPLPLLAMTV